MAEKTPFTETRIYPIIFMMIVTIVFVGLLAFFYHSSKERIENNEKLAFQKKILTLFSLPVDNPAESFTKYIKTETKHELTYYKAEKDGSMLGYAFVINGPGLWGSIKAVAAFTSDLKKIIRFDILNQNETPGLGGRITEDTFKNQFTSKELVKNNKIIDFKLIAEEETPKEDEICQITGATFSSQSVTKLIYKEMKQISKKLGFSYE